eukprot:CAMPEP_0185035928 /NCGR_PEP_ID=MMETSP1103-20130426/28093_1 /TAXON_ID=36769 /ORGANISM="Paraphysomonas bandaiensis, Strain Caron Lab Isolate" /LENGTH=725 /DNA_ID=CAMNT_0027573233 /DNA_START=324 /DNA_END=2501 /DNA_ORIENTATION=-
MEEIERRRRIKLHPYTGNFHFAPGKYSDLHGLGKYRVSSPGVNDTELNSFDESDDYYREIEQKYNGLVDGRVTFGKTRSFDDSSIIGRRTFLRCSSDTSAISSSSAPLNDEKEGLDPLDTALSERMLNLRKYGKLNGQVHRDSDPTPISPTSRIKKFKRAKAKHVGGIKTRHWQPDNSDKRDKSPPRRKRISPPLPPHSEPAEPLHLTEPKGSWQVHGEEGAKGFAYVNGNGSTRSAVRQVLTDKYELHPDKILGEGSYAVVILATCKETGTYVAVKVISKSKGGSPEEEARFQREIDHQSRLWHHNVVAVRDVYESSESVYMVLDYCPGGTLEQMLQLRRRLDEEETRFIAYQLLSGLAYIHENGVLHGDLKPGNIMFTPPTAAALEASDAAWNRVDLLFEKKKREGTLTISLNQAPVVDYDAVMRSEGRAEEDARNGKSGIVSEAKQAYLRERLVHGTDIQSVGGAPVKARRGSSGNLEASMGGGAQGFASAAHRNHLRRRKKPRNPALTPSSSSEEAALVDRDSESGDQQTQEQSGTHKGGRGRSESGRSIEVDERYQGHIRYKCPYGMLVRVCDFGLSQKIPDVKHFKHTGDVRKAPYTPGGTEGYLAPEIMAHKPYGLAADLWAIGTVLYKCLSGNLPFVPPTACLERDAKFNGPAWRKISQPCKDLLASLLTADEGARPSAKQCLHHSWFADILIISDGIIPEIGSPTHGDAISLANKY